MPAADLDPAPGIDLGAMFGAFADRRQIALAVSGGADSLALMLLAGRWREGQGGAPELLVMTVDHGLRDGSSAEAAFVEREALRLGLRHLTLRWEGAKPDTGIEEAAREARYRLLVDACRSESIADLLTAHHQDDQAETVLMRLGRGSGVTGLAGMRRARDLGDGVTLHRPLLDMAKAELADVVDEAGIVPVDDSSNADLRFARPRLRSIASALTAAGIEKAGIARAAERLGQADEALDYAVAQFLEEASRIDSKGGAWLDRRHFRAVPAAIRQRALARLLAAAGGRAWPPVRQARLESLVTALIEDSDFVRTLGGAVVQTRGDDVVIAREAGRAGGGNPNRSRSEAEPMVSADRIG